jgi:hypothetical protein
MGVAAAGRVVVGKSVDQADAGTPLEQRRNVDHVGAARVDRRDDLEQGENVCDFARHVELRSAYDDVLAPRATTAPLVEQLERFANASRITEKDLELTSACSPLDSLDLTQQDVRIAALILTVGLHRANCKSGVIARERAGKSNPEHAMEIVRRDRSRAERTDTDLLESPNDGTPRNEDDLPVGPHQLASTATRTRGLAEPGARRTP